MSYQKELENLVLSNQKLSGVKKILIFDGKDPRAIKAAKNLKSQGLVHPILLSETQFDSEGVELEVLSEEKIQLFAKEFFEFRKGKETEEGALKAMKTLPFYACMLLRKGLVDGVIGGLEFPTADILRAAFKVIGPVKGIKTISSVMIMHKNNEKFIFSDISVNISPSSEQLAEIGHNATLFAKNLGFNPNVAFLSFSTSGSGKSLEAEAVETATKLYNENASTKALGEIQFDAAMDLEIRKAKYKGEMNLDPVNVLIFPNLNAGNIGYKIAQRLGGFGAIGPIITGIAKPINDLSRGSTVEDIFNTALITALQAEGTK